MKGMQGILVLLCALLCFSPCVTGQHTPVLLIESSRIQSTRAPLEQTGEFSAVLEESSSATAGTPSFTPLNATDCSLENLSFEEMMGEETISQFATQTGQYDTVYPVTLGGIGEDVIGLNGVTNLSQTPALFVELPAFSQGVHQIWVRAEQPIAFSGKSLYFGDGGVNTVLTRYYNGTAWCDVKELTQCAFEAGEAIPLQLEINEQGRLTAAGFLATPSPNGYTATHIPSYWKEQLQRGARDITLALTKAGEQKASFLFYTDTHWNYGSQMSPTLLTYLQHHTPLSQTNFGGDIVNDEGDDEATMAYLWDWRGQISSLTNHHSVVGNHDDGNSVNHRFSKEYVYHYLLEPEHSSDLVYGQDLYYYRDNRAEKTRYFYMDTGYLEMDTAQLEFLKQGLLSTPENWHIVVFAHALYEPDYNRYDERPVPLSGYHYKAVPMLNMLDAYNARTGEFEGAKAKVEFCMGGHCHRDFVGTSPAGIPLITIETDSRHIRSEFTYTSGTATEAAVSGVIADYEQQTLTLIRVGRGNSFSVDLNTAVKTELQPTPVPEQPPEPPKVYPNLLEGVGFTENARISSSSGELKEQAGTYTTGLIPVPMGGDTFVYLSGITMPDEYDAMKNNVSCYDGDGNYIAGTTFPRTSQSAGFMPLFDEQGNLVRFMIGFEGVAYIRISGMYMDEHSKVWVEVEFSPEEPAPPPPLPEEEPTVTPGDTEQPIPPETPSDVDPSNLLTQAGFTENTRLSSSSGELREQAGSYTTGLIPVPTATNVVVCLSGITMPDVYDTTKNNVACYDKNGNYIAGTAFPRTSQSGGSQTLFDEQGNLIWFMINYENVAYIRITGMYMDEHSKVWVE